LDTPSPGIGSLHRRRDDVDDPPVAALAHAGQHGLQQRVPGEQVLLERALECILRRGRHLPGRWPAGVVHQDVDAGIDVFGDRLAHGDRIGIVDGHAGVRLPGLRRQRLRRRLQSLTIAGQQHDACAAGGEDLGGGGARCRGWRRRRAPDGRSGRC
jgi:hypothetical protein